MNKIILSTILLSTLYGCAVISVADAGISIAATTVSTAVSVTGSAISSTAKHL